MLYLGYLGKNELAGGSLALGFANITGLSVLKGLAMGMDPICGQAFGAKRDGQDADISHVAKVYLTFSIPELIGQAVLHPMRSFLRTQGFDSSSYHSCSRSIDPSHSNQLLLGNILEDGGERSWIGPCLQHVKFEPGPANLRHGVKNAIETLAWRFSSLHLPWMGAIVIASIA
ncbi:MULTIDRUG RESISTANCE PROTEIN [Salix viminalis]|uniref:MULTIDRUG RESISTANCE PROTEIN n=1 Tax=Salix viminalis TaxID=40686 RepID=A0A9Q0V5K1_SALVM|nr:MULTIDRUG RESISTANCE PROTEIN [Salix viminalis]